MKKKTDAQSELEQKLADLTADLQRTRADFENYRKRVEFEKESARAAGKSAAILKLLPVIDNIERAIAFLPDDLKDHKWAQSVAGLIKNLDTSLASLDLRRIDAKPGTVFNPELHEAISIDEADGDKEVIKDELQPGYRLGGAVIRHSLVNVTRK